MQTRRDWITRCLPALALTPSLLRAQTAIEGMKITVMLPTAKLYVGDGATVEILFALVGGMAGRVESTPFRSTGTTLDITGGKLEATQTQNRPIRGVTLGFVIKPNQLRFEEPLMFTGTGTRASRSFDHAGKYVFSYMASVSTRPDPMNTRDIIAEVKIENGKVPLNL